jgi:hypothetical protein
MDSVRETLTRGFQVLLSALILIAPAMAQDVMTPLADRPGFSPAGSEEHYPYVRCAALYASVGRSTILAYDIDRLKTTNSSVDMLVHKAVRVAMQSGLNLEEAKSQVFPLGQTLDAQYTLLIEEHRTPTEKPSLRHQVLFDSDLSACDELLTSMLPEYGPRPKATSGN